MIKLTKAFSDEERASIQEEYEKATSNTEIEHGSGFIIHNHFIITNKHVIETYLDNKAIHEIHISNAAIDDISCKDAHCDPGKDLALLYCLYCPGCSKAGQRYPPDKSLSSG